MNAVCFPDLQQLAHKYAEKIAGDNGLIATHCYTNAQGQPLYWKIRAKQPNGEKVIRPFHWSDDGFKPKEPEGLGNKKPLYRLHEIVQTDLSRAVYIVEGEQKADYLSSLGFIATTSGGSTSVNTTDWQPLVKHHCIIWRDNDDAGLAWQSKIVEILKGLNCAIDLIDIAKLDLPPKGDVIDWLAKRTVINMTTTHFNICELPIIKETILQTEIIAEWDEPLPIECTLKPVASFMPDLLPETLRDWVLDESVRMSCPHDFVAAAVLCSLGIVIGARTAIKPKALDDWSIVPNLWGGVVGMPSSKKSPSIDAGMKPLDHLISIAREEKSVNAKREYELSVIVHKAQEEGVKTRLKKAGQTGKEDIAAIAIEMKQHQENQPKLPPLRRYRTNDCTVESLGELERDNPRGILVLRDELVGLLTSMDKDGKESDRAFYLEGWNGLSSYETDRIMRGNISIENHCLSVFGGIQPDKLISYLEAATHGLSNDGLLQRFQLLVYPDPVKWEYCDCKPDKAAFDKVLHVFEKIDTLSDIEIVGYGAWPADQYNKRPYFRFSCKAQELYVEWTTRLNRETLMHEDQPIIAQHLMKYEKLMPSLALIFHLVDCVTLQNSGEVSHSAVQRAVAWCDYLETHARRCYGLLLDEGQRAANALAEKLLKISKVSTDKTDETQHSWLIDGFTVRDIQRKQWRHLTQNTDVQRAIDWLEGEGWLMRIEHQSTAQGGRPSTSYKINPKLKYM